MSEFQKNMADYFVICVNEFSSNDLIAHQISEGLSNICYTVMQKIK